jgi:uncharacterized membrane protein
MVLSFFGGFDDVGLYVHLMFWLGLVMMLIFFHVFFAPYKKLKSAVERQDWPAGGKQLGQIRVLVGVNTVLGLLVVAIASAGRFLLN